MSISLLLMPLLAQAAGTIGSPYASSLPLEIIEKKNDEIADAQSRRDALAEALQEERAQHARGGVLLRRKLKGEFLGKN